MGRAILNLESMFAGTNGGDPHAWEACKENAQPMKSGAYNNPPPPPPPPPNGGGGASYAPVKRSMLTTFCSAKVQIGGGGQSWCSTAASYPSARVPTS